jgi:hypothetical protein
MSWPITTIWATRNSARLACLGLVLTAIGPRAMSQDLQVPASVVAGSETTLRAAGSGDATFYLVGPASSAKRTVHLGEDIRLQREDVQAAGRYVAFVCQETCRNAEFYVIPAKVSSLRLLVHPSRAAIGQPDVLSGVALPFDAYQNLVLNTSAIDFHLRVGEQDTFSRSIPVENGVAWFRTNSANRAGALQVIATAGEISARRVVQQVASDPCHLQVKADRDAKGIELETDPVRDCAGNPVPDGTIVTFRGTGANGVSTVDAPVKQGVARARIIANGPMQISVASGVVMGNQVSVGAQR